MTCFTDQKHFIGFQANKIEPINSLMTTYNAKILIADCQQAVNRLSHVCWGYTNWLMGFCNLSPGSEVQAIPGALWWQSACQQDGSSRRSHGHSEYQPVSVPHTPRLATSMPHLQGEGGFGTNNLFEESLSNKRTSWLSISLQLSLYKGIKSFASFRIKCVL